MRDATDPSGLEPSHVGVEMHYLQRRMHTGVGAPGRNDRDRLPGNLG